MLLEPIVDPEPNDCPDLVRDLVETDELASDRWRGDLGDEDGCSGGDGAYAETDEDTTGVDVGHVGAGDRLKDRSDAVEIRGRVSEWCGEGVMWLTRLT